MATACGTQNKTATSTKPLNDDKAVAAGPRALSSDRVEEQAFIDGCRYRMLGETEKALAKFGECLKQNPNNDAALYEVAGIYADQKDYTKALEYLLPAIRLNGTTKWYRILAADIYEAQQNYSAAAEQMRVLSQQNPDDADFTYDYGFFLVKNGEYEKAIDAYNKIEKKAGVTEEISVAKKDLWLRLNKPDKAIDEVIKLRNAYPNEASYQAMLADLYIETGKEDQAMQAIKGLADVDSTNTQAQLAVAEHHLKRGEWTEAYDALKVVFADNRVDIDFKVKVLLGYFPALQNNVQRQTEAISLGQILTKAHPDDAKSWALYGDVLSQSNKNKEALDAYSHAVKLDDGKFTVWQQLMFLQAALEMKDSLLASSQAALELFPDQPLAYYFNGVAHAQRKECALAVKSYDRVLMMGLEDKGLLSQVHASIGDCYNTLQRFAAADSSFDLALQYDGQNVYALNNYAYYLAQRNTGLDKAEKMAYKVVSVLAPTVPTYMDTYAYVLYRMGRYQDAKTWSEKAIAASKKESPTVLEHYGDILFKLQQQNEAVTNWQKALNAGGEKEKLEKKIRDRQVYE